MSHRARGGISGQFDGELEKRYAMVMGAIQRMESIAAERMGQDLDHYKKMIKDEYWVHGDGAVPQGAADEMINVACGTSLSGKRHSYVNTIFGLVQVTFSKCPLINGVINVKIMKIKKNVVKEDLEKAVRMSFEDPKNYYLEYIKTGLHTKYFYE